MLKHENTVDWLWLQEALGVNACIDFALNYFGTPGELRQAGEREWRLSGMLSPDQIRRMAAVSMDTIKRRQELCRLNGWQILTPDSDLYPKLLREIKNRPAVLYAMGEPENWSNNLKIAVVGARAANPYSVAVAREFCKQFAQAGAVTVSGGALGIDSAAHRGAIEGGGKTVAFLGCGFGVRYLQENEELRRRIAENGAVITEFPPHTPADRRTFPIRNRLISGMCDGTVVIEAGEKSGSLITARCAADQDRDVFAVPGDIVSSSYTGANKLIYNGARAVFSGLDVLEEYSERYADTLNLSNVEKINIDVDSVSFTVKNTGHNHKNKNSKPAKTVKPEAKPVKPLPENEEQRKICELLLKNKVLHVDEIATALEKRSFEILPILTRLELSGYITVDSGRLCRIKSE